MNCFADAIRIACVARSACRKAPLFLYSHLVASHTRPAVYLRSPRKAKPAVPGKQSKQPQESKASKSEGHGPKKVKARAPGKQRAQHQESKGQSTRQAKATVSRKQSEQFQESKGQERQGSNDAMCGREAMTQCVAGKQ